MNDFPATGKLSISLLVFVVRGERTQRRTVVLRRDWDCTEKEARQTMEEFKRDNRTIIEGNFPVEYLWTPHPVNLG